MKKFCIISVDKEGYVPRDGHPSIKYGLKSLEDQTFKDFHVIIAHDGPKSNTYQEEGILSDETNFDFTVLNTPLEMGDYGNWSRDMAMRYAYENNLGEYYIHHNIDNEFFPHALQTISDAIDNSEDKIFIFQEYHHKDGGDILTGIPPVLFKIDCMQLVAHKDIWKEVNFWYDKHPLSDGYIYEELCKKYSWTEIPFCLGHNY